MRRPFSERRKDCQRKRKQNRGGAEKNPKSEAPNPKWFDELTTLSQVEGQIQNTNAPMIKTMLNNTT